MSDLSKSPVGEWQSLLRESSAGGGNGSAIEKANPVSPRGAASKAALLASPREDVRVIDCREWSGVITYDPSEFLITAASGTEVLELQDTLAEHGQYLPFDPLFVEQRATLGGTIAAGISGPCCLLYGSLRDFVMEVEFVDGLGNLVRGGGKVVKNAAGFDFPKLMVGSYGRLGILTEITLKVLPEPRSHQILEGGFSSFEKAADAARRLAGEPLPLAAAVIDANNQLQVQFSGLSEAMQQVELRVKELLDGALELSERKEIDRGNFGISSQEQLLRIVVSPAKMSELFEAILSAENELELISASPLAGTAWLKAKSLKASEKVDRLLAESMGLGVVVRGAVSDLMPLGARSWLKTASRIQAAMDPKHNFLPYL